MYQNLHAPETVYIETVVRNHLPITKGRRIFNNEFYAENSDTSILGLEGYKQHR
jgi:hypothetical protein